MWPKSLSTSSIERKLNVGCNLGRASGWWKHINRRSFNERKLHHRSPSRAERKQQSCVHARRRQNAGRLTLSAVQFLIKSEALFELFKDCNRCRCAANGIGWFCTRRACPPKGLKKRAVQSPLSDCVPGSRWNDGCNNCICTGIWDLCIFSVSTRLQSSFITDNRIPICTLMHCFGLHENLRAKRSTKECTPGTTWKQDCNTCFCSETGEAWDWWKKFKLY